MTSPCQLRTELRTAIEEEISVCKRHSGDVAGGRGSKSFDSPPDLPERTAALVRGLDLVLEHHDAPLPIRVALDK